MPSKVLKEQTLGAAHAAWHKARATDVGEARLRADETRYDKFITVKFPPETPVASITSKRVESWLTYLAKQTGPPTQQATLMVFRQILDTAVQAKHLKANPVKGFRIDVPKGIAARDDKDFIGQPELDAIVRAAVEGYGPLIRFAAETGATWAETLGIRVEDIDFGSLTARIGAVEIVESNGIAYEQTNPRESTRHVRISKALAKELSFIIEHETWRQKASAEDRKWLFLTPNQHKHPLRSNFNRHIWRPALIEAGLDERAYTFHDLRHTAAIRMVSEGIALEKVQRILGHDHLRTTREMYGAFAPAPKASRK